MYRRFLFCLKHFVVITCLFAAAQSAMATGGYISFPTPANAPQALDELNYYLQMVSNPGSTANAYYAYNYKFVPEGNAAEIRGYMGLQSTNIFGKSTYALATIWPQKGQVLSMTAGPNADCYIANGTAEGDIATCKTNPDNPLTQAMANGDNFRVYIRLVGASTWPSRSKIFEFGVENLRTRSVSVLGHMQLANMAGINSKGVSHFLEYFGSNLTDCRQIPYTSYIQNGPVGISSGLSYPYTVVPHQEPFGPCPARLTTLSTTSMKVEFALNSLWGTTALVTQAELSQLDFIGRYLKKLFESNGTVTIATSSYNWVPLVMLPENLKDGFAVLVHVNSNFPVNVVYSGKTVALNKGAKVSFIRRGGTWVYQPEYVIKDQAELSKFDQYGRYLQSVMDQNSQLAVVTSDGNWIPSMSLPAQSREGRQVRFEINSGYGVTIFYNGISTQVPSRSLRLFTYRAGQWRAETYEVPKMASLDNSGDYLGKLFQLNYGSIRVKSADGNWIKTVVLPKAPPQGSTVILDVQSGWGVDVLYNGRTSSFGTGSLRSFVFQNGAWVLI